MDFNIEAPWVGNAPYEEEQPKYCPCCGEEADEFFISRDTGEIVGCDKCLTCIDSWEWEED